MLHRKLKSAKQSIDLSTTFVARKPKMYKLRLLGNKKRIFIIYFYNIEMFKNV